jgi:hypothetical protein
MFGRSGCPHCNGEGWLPLRGDMRLADGRQLSDDGMYVRCNCNPTRAAKAKKIAGPPKEPGSQSKEETPPATRAGGSHATRSGPRAH